jgi:serine/threonine protein kinase
MKWKHPKALEYLHYQAALIHRDIKAGNLLLTEDGDLKLGNLKSLLNLVKCHTKKNLLFPPKKLQPILVFLRNWMRQEALLKLLLELHTGW